MTCTLCVFSVLSFWEWAVRGILAWSFSFVYQGLKQRWVKNSYYQGRDSLGQRLGVPTRWRMPSRHDEDSCVFRYCGVP